MYEFSKSYPFQVNTQKELRRSDNGAWIIKNHYEKIHTNIQDSLLVEFSLGEIFQQENVEKMQKWISASGDEKFALAKELGISDLICGIIYRIQVKEI